MTDFEKRRKELLNSAGIDENYLRKKNEDERKKAISRQGIAQRRNKLLENANKKAAFETVLTPLQDSYIKRASKYYDDLYSEYESLNPDNYDWAAGYGKGNAVTAKVAGIAIDSAKKAALVAQQGIIRSYLDNNRSLIGGANADAILKQFDEFNTTTDSMEEENRKMRSLLSNYKSREEYDAALKANEDWYNAWGHYMDAEDFDQFSSYELEPRKKQSARAILMDDYSDEASGWEDPLREAINGSEEARGFLYTKASVSGGTMPEGENYIGAFLGGLDNGKTEIKEMTEDEVKIFNYLYATEGKEKAHEFYNAIQGDLRSREMQKALLMARLSAKSDPFGTSLATIALSPLKGLSYVSAAGDYLAGNGIDINKGSMRLSRVSTETRNAVATEIEKTGWGKFGSWGYQLGMSMGDSLMALGYGGGGAFTLAIMGAGAAADVTISAKQRGLNDDQAFLLGTIAGAIEAATEKIGLDEFLDIALAGSSPVKYMLRNSLGEGTEELLSGVGNFIADTAIARDKSEWAAMMKKYKDQGMSDPKAFAMAFLETSGSIALDTLGGLVSGLGFGGMGLTTSMFNNASTGRDVIDNGSVEGLRDMAGEYKQYADKIDRRHIEGLSKKVSAETKTGEGFFGKIGAGVGNFVNQARVGGLYNAVAETVQKQNTADIKTALEAVGLKGGKLKTATDILSSIANGEEISDSDLKFLGKNEGAMSVFTDVVLDKNSSVNKRNAQLAQQIEGGTVSAEQTAAPTQEKASTEESVYRENEVPAEANTEATEHTAESTKKVRSRAHATVISNGKDESATILTPGHYETVDGKQQWVNGTVSNDSGFSEDVTTADFADPEQGAAWNAFANLGQTHTSTEALRNMDADTATELLALYDENENTSGTDFAEEILNAYFYGTIGASAKFGKFKSITDEQMQAAWELGNKLYNKTASAVDTKTASDIAEAQKKLKDSGKKVTGTGDVILEEDVYLEDFSKTERATYDIAVRVSKAANVKIHIYRGATSALGSYNRSTDEILLNINAKQSAKSLMAFTLAHELVHRAKKGSPAQYRAFQKFLLDNYARQGSSLDAMIDQQIAAANEFDKTIADPKKRINMTREMALEEVVCDACERMLLDSSVNKKLAQFAALSEENRTFVERVKEWIEQFMDRLRKLFKDVDPTNLAAAEFEKFDLLVKNQLAEMFVDMTVTAGENLATLKAAYGGKTAKQMSDTRDIAFNLALTETHKGKLEQNFSEESDTDLETIMTRYDKIIKIWKRLGGELSSNFLEEWNSKVGKDRTFTIFKAQAGYKYNVELSSMCKKGVPLFEAIDTIVKQEVMRELGTGVLGKAEKEILYDILKDHHFEIPCAICYVEQARQREGVIIDAFLNGKTTQVSKSKTDVKLGWNQVLDSIEKEMQANGVNFGFAEVSRDIATDKYTPANLEMDEETTAAFYAALKKIANQEIARYNKAEGKKRPLLADTTPEAVKKCFKGTLPSNLKIFKVLFNEPSSRFRMQDDLLYSSMTTQNLSSAHHELYSLFNSQGGVSGYKTKQGTTIYWGDILGKKWNPEKLRDEGGVRNQSNSDFQMFTLLDHAQMFLDFTAKGYYLQAYTKVLAELKLFGLSRGKMNASLIPKVVEYKNSDGSVDVEKTKANAGLDENGNPIYDDIEGINHAEAFMLLEDPEYSKSLCGICIGYSDAHIAKLLDDPRVQQIIGFHDKTDDGTKRYRGARYAKNYNGLNEATKVDAEGKTKTIHIGFNPYVKKAEKKFNYNAQTESYEGTVVYNGKTYTADDIPMLAADLYLEMCAKKGYSPAYNDFSGHPNYYKLLADFGLKDSEGHYAPHRKVVYNMPDTVPYLDANGKKQTMPTYDYIRNELQKELAVRDSIAEALADDSSEGIIPQFKEKVRALHEGSDASTDDIVRSVPKSAESVDSKGKELSVNQQNYFAFSVVRNAAGNLMVMYHGTSYGGHTVFDSWGKGKYGLFGIGTYFTESKAIAESYTQKGKGNNPQVYECYLNIKNPMDMDAQADPAEWRSAFPEADFPESGTNEEFYRAAEMFLEDEMIPRWEGEERMRDAIQATMGYDGITHMGGGRVDPNGERHRVYIAFESEQIKSVDNLNPTDNVDISRKLPIEQDTSPRALLAQALESVATNDAELEKLRQYKANIETLNGLEARLQELRAEIKKLSLAKGKRDTARIAELRDEATKTANRIKIMDSKLMRLEATSVLQKVVDRERQNAAAKRKQMEAEYRRRNREQSKDQEILGREYLRLLSEYDKLGKISEKDMALFEKEYSRLLAEYEKEHGRRVSFETMIKELRQKQQELREDSNIYAQEYQRLMKEYEKQGKAGERDIALIEKEYSRLLNEYEKEHGRKVSSDAEIRRLKQKAKDNVEGRKKTEMRKKIRKKIRDLTKLFKGGKDSPNVKKELRDAIATAIAAGEVLFIDNYTTDDMIRNGITGVTTEASQLLNEAKDILYQLDNPPAVINVEDIAAWDKQERKYRDRLNQIKAQLKQVFADERARLDGTTVETLMDGLYKAYSALKNSDTEYIKAAFDPKTLETLSAIREGFGTVSIKEMRLDQLEELYKAYAMVLGTVRNSNKLFGEMKKKSLAETISTLFANTTRATPKTKLSVVARKISDAIGWDYEKLYYALERINNPVITELFTDLANSENRVMEAVEEAKQEMLRIVKKYGYNKWKVDERFDTVFVDNLGKEFQLTLGEVMSLYAYTRRDSAWNHLEVGGFVPATTKLTELEKIDPYKLTKKQCEAIIDKLTDDQKRFVEEMQRFLSENMGAKGNEVSMMLYGIELFGEDNYFPIRIVTDFMARAQEAQAKEAAGFGSMSNAGFTHVQNKNSVSPVMMESFMNVWTDHVNEMSRYYGTVPALENIRKVMNYQYSYDGSVNSVSTKVLLRNTYGKKAVEYLDDLYKEANTGAIRDKMQGLLKKAVSLTRKNSVAYSASTWIQQPASIVRAFAVLPRKYFTRLGATASVLRGGARALLDRKNYLQDYAEMRKYAPGVTIAKEIGGFDTAGGRSILGYLRDTGKNTAQKWQTGDAKGKVGAVMDLVDDNAIANIPEFMDKIAWIEIWNACKREVHATHKTLSPKSDEFFETVGKRFTEVIRATQVYDSIFAKSPMLKSQNMAVQYIVSFMNEPNTTANMFESAIRDFAKGTKDGTINGAKKIHAVLGSTIFTALLSSIIYAMRDDDEDETYIEKYLSSVTEKFLDDITVFNYIPYLRDVWSLTKGFDVSRPDTDVIASVISGIANVIKNRNVDTSEMTEWELDQFMKKVSEDNWKLAGAICSAFGIPLKNVYRDSKAILDYSGAPIKETTMQKIVDSLEEAVNNTSPFFWKHDYDSKSKKLYNAIVNGDDEYIDRLKPNYLDKYGEFSQEKFDSAVTSALKEHDPRIVEAAQAQIDGDPSRRVEIAEDIMADGFDKEVVRKAINSVINKMTPSKESTPKVYGFYDAEDFALEIANGDKDGAKVAKDGYIETKMLNGKTKDEAVDAFNSAAKSELKKLYISGGLTEKQVTDALERYCNEDVSDIHWNIKKWDYEKENGTTEGYTKYNDFYSAVQNGKNLKSVIREYTSNGVDSEDLASEITAHFKPIYKSMSRTQRNALKEKLLDAYVALGYDEAKRSKSIDKWLED